MDDKGQIYFDSEDEISEADRQRHSDAHAALLLRTVKNDYEERVARLSKEMMDKCN